MCECVCVCGGGKKHTNDLFLHIESKLISVRSRVDSFGNNRHVTRIPNPRHWSSYPAGGVSVSVKLLVVVRR